MGKDECWLLGAHGTREHVKTLRSVTFADLLAHLYPLALYLRKALTRPNREGTKFCRRQTIAIAMADGYWPVQNVFNNSLCAQQASKLLYLSPGSTLHRQQLRPKIGLCVVGMGGKPLAYLLLITIPLIPLILCRRSRQEIVQQIRCAGQVCRDRETLASLLLGLLGQRQKNRCLVAIEVCLQETTGQRV